MNEKAIYQFLGLCQRAGKLLSGNEQLRDGLKNKKGKLLILAEDASPRTAKEYGELADRLQIERRTFGKKDILGQALGKGVRTAVLVADSGMAAALCRKLDAGR